jgi:hypothetical protein
VGLQFVLPDGDDAYRGKVTLLDSADKEEVDRFLVQLRQEK